MFLYGSFLPASIRAHVEYVCWPLIRIPKKYVQCGLSIATACVLPDWSRSVSYGSAQASYLYAVYVARTTTYRVLVVMKNQKCLLSDSFSCARLAAYRSGVLCSVLIYSVLPLRLLLISSASVTWPYWTIPISEQVSQFVDPRQQLLVRFQRQEHFQNPQSQTWLTVSAVLIVEVIFYFRFPFVLAIWSRPLSPMPCSESITNGCLSPDLRSHDPSAEKVLGDKAVGGIDADKDHVPNVISGLKA